MKILNLTAAGADGVLQPFYIANPANLVITTGVVQKPGVMKDGHGNPIMVEEVKTFVHVAGKPLIVEETVDEVLEQLV